MGPPSYFTPQQHLGGTIPFSTPLPSPTLDATASRAAPARSPAPQTPTCRCCRRRRRRAPSGTARPRQPSPPGRRAPPLCPRSIGGSACLSRRWGRQRLLIGSSVAAVCKSAGSPLPWRAGLLRALAGAAAGDRAGGRRAGPWAMRLWGCWAQYNAPGLAGSAMQRSKDTWAPRSVPRFPQP